MVQNQIHNDLYAPPVTFRKQLFEILHRAISGVDFVIIRHIIFMICGRRIYRHQPDTVTAEIRIRRIVPVVDIIEPRDQPLQISDSVPVAVIIRINENFIICAVIVIDHL